MSRAIKHRKELKGGHCLYKGRKLTLAQNFSRAFTSERDALFPFKADWEGVA